MPVLKDDGMTWEDLSAALQQAEGDRTHLLAVVQIYRERLDVTCAALDGVKKLFDDPAPYYIKKLGGPITNGDQDQINAVFRNIESAVEQARGAV